MYKSAIAALTMTAAALLLTAVPALADEDLDYRGPSITMCDKGVTYAIRMGSPMSVRTTITGCEDEEDEEDEHGHGYGMY
ncbi:hypothetical protein HD597_001267 [Nonomuraea thailandensis]|uniref:Uncharacterized protein n=1 Tax=Nonomuraea thailandensis TaxID=1188745 RepID=A0A9X2JYI2_9ACTN|nr:hypothetical protein [Nonomuraea thailandensis]MCP2354247.1 hypothetical protein [Nonomuraea thailandensis]